MGREGPTLSPALRLALVKAQQNQSKVLNTSNSEQPSTEGKNGEPFARKRPAAATVSPFTSSQVTPQETPTDAQLIAWGWKGETPSDASSPTDNKNEGELVGPEKKRLRRSNVTPHRSAAVVSPSLQTYVRPEVLNKFFRRRYSLFSRFDEGIRLDYESWFSVTPEVLAVHTAERLRCDVLIDAFCGAGGSAIQFAETCERVICCDIDPVKVELCRHNAAIYNVADRMEFCVGDIRKLLVGSSRAGPHGQRRSNAADIVYLAPPWGGPDYSDMGKFDLKDSIDGLDVVEVFRLARRVTENLCMLLPKTTEPQQIREMMESSGGLMPCEIERNYIDGFLVSLSVYFGQLAET
jgi:trimethylguanosine synthase